MSEPEMRIIMSSENWETVRQEGGDLVAVAVSPGVFVKMKRAEAEKKGLIGKEAAEAATTNRKKRKAAGDKRRVAEGDK